MDNALIEGRDRLDCPVGLKQARGPIGVEDRPARRGEFFDLIDERLERLEATCVVTGLSPDDAELDLSEQPPLSGEIRNGSASVSSASGVLPPIC